MTLRDTILKGAQATQTPAAAKASLSEMLNGPSVVGVLRRMRSGHSVGQSDFAEFSLTHAEFNVAVTDAAIRQRLTELEKEGIIAQFFDGETTRTGMRGKCLKVAILPFPDAPRVGG